MGLEMVNEILTEANRCRSLKAQICDRLDYLISQFKALCSDMRCDYSIYKVLGILQSSQYLDSLCYLNLTAAEKESELKEALLVVKKAVLVQDWAYFVAFNDAKCMFSEQEME